MSVIDQDMRQVIARAMVSYVAAVLADGSPSLSPKGSVMVYDDSNLIFMNQASPGTVANLKRDPRVEINAVDILRRRGYRFKGRARIAPPGDAAYAWLKQELLALNGPGYPAHEAALYTRDASLHGFAISTASTADVAVAAADINRMLAAGQLRGCVGATYSLHEAARAQQALAQGQVRGRIVILH